MVQADFTELRTLLATFATDFVAIVALLRPEQGTPRPLHRRHDVLHLLYNEVDLAMALAGCRTVADITRDLIAKE